MQERAWSAERCARLLNKSHQTPRGWKACCPAHEDNNPSLFLADGTDGLALKCYAGCDYRDIAEALELKGAVLSRSQDRNQIPGEHFQLGAYHSHWDYSDAAGRTIMRICRWEQPGGKKDIRPLVRTADGWKWQHHPSPRPLFNLDRLVNDPELPVLIVEGEKTATAAQRLFPSHIATTWPGGAQSVGAVDLQVLAGRSVVLVPDCDAPGRKAMEWMQQHVREIAKDVRIVDPGKLAAGLPDGWDLADALREGREVGEWLKAPEPAFNGHDEEEPRSKFDLRWFSATTLTTAATSVAGLIGQNSLVLIYGESGTGKSTFSLDLELAVARGIPWRGLATSAGAVIHVCGEGMNGVQQRLLAYANRNMAGELQDIPFASVPGAVQLMNPPAVDALSDRLEAVGKEHGGVRLVVFDTLARCMSPGDENDGGEMGLAIQQCDHIRERLNCAVILIHHAGKDTSKGARGHSSLRAAVDTEILIEGTEGLRTARVMKQRDLPSGGPFLFELQALEIGHDDRGAPITACVVEHKLDALPPPNRVTGAKQRDILRMLEDEYRKGNTVWTLGDIRQLAKDRLMLSKQTAHDAVARLHDMQFLIASVGGSTLTDPPKVKL